jgi:hypothetical protein
MTMGYEDDGDPPIGNPGVAYDSVDVAMDLKETTASVVRKSVEKSGSKTSTSTSTSCKYKDKDKNKNNDEVHDKDNGQSTRVDVAMVGMDLEASVAGQSMENPGNNFSPKESIKISIRYK